MDRLPGLSTLVAHYLWFLSTTNEWGRPSLLFRRYRISHRHAFADHAQLPRYLAEPRARRRPEARRVAQPAPPLPRLVLRRLVALPRRLERRRDRAQAFRPFQR